MGRHELGHRIACCGRKVSKTALSVRAAVQKTADAAANDRPAPVAAAGENVPVDDPSPTPEPEETAFDLGRAAWLVTTLAAAIAAVIVFLEGYYGYAGVTAAVAIAAGINLL